MEKNMKMRGEEGGRSPACGGGRAGGLLLRRVSWASGESSREEAEEGSPVICLPTPCCFPAAGSQEVSLDTNVRRFSTGVSS